MEQGIDTCSIYEVNDGSIRFNYIGVVRLFESIIFVASNLFELYLNNCCLDSTRFDSIRFNPNRLVSPRFDR